jgi:hypothetical protein
MRAYRYLMLVSAMVILGCTKSVLAQDGNLIEYSYGGFAGGFQSMGPMLLPPMLKIYQSGDMILLQDNSAWIGHIDIKLLNKLKKSLARNPILKTTKLFPNLKGGSPGYHGGMAYIRYLDGQAEIIIASLRLPSGGSWARLIEELYLYVPSTYTLFVPAQLTVLTYPGGSWQKPIEWPFSNTLPLSGRKEAEELLITDPKVIQFILSHLNGGFSWIQVVVSEGSIITTLHVKAVPAWYEPMHIEMMLGFLWMDYELEQEHPQDNNKPEQGLPIVGECP